MIADRSVAEKVSTLMVEFGARLNESVATVQASYSESEFSAYRAAVGRLMGAMLLDIMNPIYGQHPDLKPPQLISN